MDGTPTRWRFNAAQRRALRVESIRPYETKAGRRAQKGREPNDRKHDREVEGAVRRANPLLLAALLTEDDPAADGTDPGP